MSKKQLLLLVRIKSEKRVGAEEEKLEETVKSQKLSHWGEIVHLVSNEAVKSFTNILSPRTKTSEN